MINNVASVRTLVGLLVATSLSLLPALADTQAFQKASVTSAELAGKSVETVVSNEKSIDMTHARMVRHLRAANDVAKDMKKFGHHPFRAVLVAPDNEKVLMHQGNVSVVRHAEVELSRRAAETYFCQPRKSTLRCVRVCS